MPFTLCVFLLIRTYFNGFHGFSVHMYKCKETPKVHDVLQQFRMPEIYVRIQKGIVCWRLKSTTEAYFAVYVFLSLFLFYVESDIHMYLKNWHNLD